MQRLKHKTDAAIGDLIRQRLQAQGDIAAAAFANGAQGLADDDV